MNITLKAKLLAYCKDEVDARLQRILDAIKSAQETANEDTKSSAGDKYETGRAMMHLEQEKSRGQLSEARQLQETLSHIQPQKEHREVQLGSLVETNLGIFFIGISLGRITLEDNAYFAISPASPMGKALRGKTAGEKATVNGREVEVGKVI